MSTSTDQAKQTNTIIQAIRSIQGTNSAVMQATVTAPIVSSITQLNASLSRSLNLMTKAISGMAIARPAVTVPVAPLTRSTAGGTGAAQAAANRSQPVGPAGFLDAHILTTLIKIQRLLENGLTVSGKKSLSDEEERKEKNGKGFLGGALNTLGDTAETIFGIGSGIVVAYALIALKWRQLTGKLSESMDHVTKFLQGIGPTFTLLTRSVDAFVGKISNIVFGVSNALKEWIGGTKIARGIASLTEEGTLIGNIVRAIGGVFKWIGEAARWAGGVLHTIAPIGKLLGLVFKFVFKVLNPIGWVLMAFDALFGGLAAYDKAIKAGANMPQALMAALIGGVGGIINGLFGGLGEVLKWIWDGIMSPFADIKNMIEKFCGSIWDLGMGAIAGGMKAIVNTLWLPDEVKNWFNDGIDGFLGTGKKTAPSITAPPAPSPQAANKPTITQSTDSSWLKKQQDMVARTAAAAQTTMISAPSTQTNNVSTTIAPKIVKQPPPNPVDPMATRMLSY